MALSRHFHSEPSSSSHSYRGPWKYDVFLSFRGETRHNFTCHLDAALRGKQIKTFMDSRLDRGEQISTAILQKIEESAISLVIFSKSFADSCWCLDEVVKIVECKYSMGRAVLPIFYGVDPYDVIEDDGNFAKAIADHEAQSKEKGDKLTTDKVLKWKEALKVATNQSGWDSNVIRPDSLLVEKIVEGVLEKLNQISPNSEVNNLVGIDSRISEIEELFCIGLEDIRLIGIWGMPSIGKTTIAKALFNRYSRQFQGYYFLEDVSFKLKTQEINRLQHELYSMILGEKNLNSGYLDLENSFTKVRLRRKKVFIVIDGVENSEQLQELLLGGHGTFGLGSRIVVTSRDLQVLKIAEARLYQVERFNHFESVELFSLHAFKQSLPPRDYMEMSNQVISYCNWIPLALKVLGSTLFGRAIRDWTSALGGLGKALDPKIDQVLRISYNTLSVEEQNIFLDIACFFRGEDRSYVAEILEGCYSSAFFKTSVLVDKSLVTISDDDSLNVHDLIQEMAWAVVRDEDENEPGKRSRLWDPREIYHVLTKKKGTEAIEGIFLDICEAREMHLDSDAFVRIDNLRFLKFYISDSYSKSTDKVHLPQQGLQYLSSKLRYLHWYGFPSKSLPLNFAAELLVMLKLPYSQIKQLWSGVQDLANLKEIDLNYSKYLTKLPDLSKAENIEYMVLDGCESLTELPSSIEHHNKLKYLSLRNCKNLRRLPRRIDSKALSVLVLPYGIKVKKCPEIKGNLECLSLGGTAITELPQSVYELKSLTILSLEGCSNLTRLHKLPESIQELRLGGTMIKELPSSIECLTRLNGLMMVNCRSLTSLPSGLYKLKSLQMLNLFGCSKLESFPEIPEPMNLEMVNMGNCKMLKRLPYSIYNLNSLGFLFLNGTNIKELPPPVEQMEGIKFWDWGTFDERKVSNFKSPISEYLNYEGFEIFSSSEIPQWFSNQSIGSSITLRLPLNRHQFQGIAFCLVFAWDGPNLTDPNVRIRCKCIAQANQEEDDIIYWQSKEMPLYLDGSDKVLLWGISSVDGHFWLNMLRRKGWLSKYSGKMVSFEFYFEGQSGYVIHCKVKKCGVRHFVV